MNNENNTQGEEMSDTPNAPIKFGVQFTVLIEVADTAKFEDVSGHGQNKQTRIRVERITKSKPMDGGCGPFDTRDEAIAMLKVLSTKENFLGGFVAPMAEAPAPAAEETQVPPSEGVLREMVRQGKVPGVPADASVAVEAPDNTIPFPTTKPQPE